VVTNDGKPLKPSRVRLDALTPSELLGWAINCLGWARRDCTNHYLWEQYDDGGITSVRGLPNQIDRAGSAICTDAEGNGVWIALMSPPVGSALEYVLLEEANRLDGYRTWEDADAKLGPFHMLALQIIDRYHDLIGADREQE
jgi:hypothetical protein